MNNTDLQVKFCFDSSRDKIKTAKVLLNTKRYADCLFFCHLALEMIVKGIYIRKRRELFPIIHDISRIVELAGVELTDLELKELSIINEFNIRARYDDYKRSFYRKATRLYTIEYFNKTLKFIKWFKKQ